MRLNREDEETVQFPGASWHTPQMLGVVIQVKEQCGEGAGVEAMQGQAVRRQRPEISGNRLTILSVGGFRNVARRSGG